MKYLSKSLIPILIAILTLASPAYAISDQLRHQIQYDAVYYNPNSPTQCSGSAVGAPGSQSGGWDSGVTPPYILQQFVVQVLKDFSKKTGAPEIDVVTKEHVLALIAFAVGEGGDIHNDDLFNPFNAGINAPDLVYGVHRGNGVQSFKSFDAGVEAQTRAMTDSNHTRFIPELTNPNSTAEHFMYVLTYFQKYPGNAIWAFGSSPDYIPKGQTQPQGQAGQDAYYQRHVNLVSTIRGHYNNYAALVIGTPAMEQVEGLTAVDKLDASLLPSGGQPGSGGASDISGSSGGCQ